jgi:septal ring factor EnvC (AmiA/AmiB activator)
MASVNALSSKVKKLGDKIKHASTQLGELRKQHKEARTHLATAKKVESEKNKAKKAKAKPKAKKKAKAKPAHKAPEAGGGGGGATSGGGAGPGHGGHMPEEE